jgi:hypothetical protein
VTAALTVGRFVYLRCAECSNVWAIRERREGVNAAHQHRGGDRRVARQSPVIHDRVQAST